MLVQLALPVLEAKVVLHRLLKSWLKRSANSKRRLSSSMMR